MQQQLNWLKKNKSFLKIYHIEQVLRMPEGTLKKFVDDRRELPEHWHKPVSDWVRNFKNR